LATFCHTVLFPKDLRTLEHMERRLAPTLERLSIGRLRGGKAGTDKRARLLNRLACAHPGFVMSPASARMPPPELHAAVSGVMCYALMDGLAQEQQDVLFSWAWRKAMAGPWMAPSLI
jgi:hypothetical protein